jgi:hypothetical protein
VIFGEIFHFVQYDNAFGGCITLCYVVTENCAMRTLTLLSTGMATFTLALGYAGQSLWAGVGVAVAIGMLRLAGDWRGWDWVAEPCLAGWVGLATFGAWQELPAAWMLLGVVAALAAWDLSHFAARLRSAGAVPQATELTRMHLRRLAVVVAAGLLLGGIALGVRVEMTFGWAILAAALAVVGVSSLIRAGGEER